MSSSDGYGDPLPDKSVLELIESIYAAGADPAYWPKFIEATAKWFPASVISNIVSLGRTDLETHSAMRGLSDDHLSSYVKHYQFLNPYIDLYERFPIGKIQRLGLLKSQSEIKSHPFYQEWLKPAGGFTYAAGLTLFREPKRLLRFSIDIPESHAELEGRAAHLLSILSPHLKRAFILNERLSAAAVALQNLTGVLNQIDGACFLLRQNGSVADANFDAVAFLQESSDVRVGANGVLLFSDPAIQLKYSQTLASLRTSRTSDGTFALPPSRVGVQFSVSLLPIVPLSTLAQQAMSGATLLVIRDVGLGKLSVEASLISVYGLTKTEANIAAQLASGLDTEEIADLASISRTTVRNHIAAIRSKLGVRRQGEIVGLVHALVPRLRG